MTSNSTHQSSKPTDLKKSYFHLLMIFTFGYRGLIKEDFIITVKKQSKLYLK